MIVLDTNVLSEMVRPSPSPEVSSWFVTHAGSSLYTTSISQAEMLLGVELLPPGKRREALRRGVAAIFEEELAGRVLVFDQTAAAEYANIRASRKLAGRPMQVQDAQIAAIARCRGATIATRNTRDFEGCGVELINPRAFFRSNGTK